MRAGATRSKYFHLMTRSALTPCESERTPKKKRNAVRSVDVITYSNLSPADWRMVRSKTLWSVTQKPAHFKHRHQCRWFWFNKNYVIWITIFDRRWPFCFATREIIVSINRRMIGTWNIFNSNNWNIGRCAFVFKKERERTRSKNQQEKPIIDADVVPCWNFTSNLIHFRLLVAPT